jgi:hypothetical protein
VVEQVQNRVVALLRWPVVPKLDFPPEAGHLP